MRSGDQVIPPQPAQNRRGSGTPVIARDRVIGEVRAINQYSDLSITGSPDRITGSSIRLIKAWHIVIAVFREIFDENAYERFLARTHGTRSVASYREFIQERESDAAPRARCC
jgi:Selenoprotein, putative